MTDPPIETVKARIGDTIDIMTRLNDYYTPSEASRFMVSPHPQLNGETPMSVIVDGRAWELFAIFERLDSGAYL